MSLQKSYPFRRVSVDYMVHGISRVWWQLDAGFKDPGPYIFQVQVGGTGLAEADDWQNIGAPVVDGFYTTDNKSHSSGAVLVTHYRVTLTTPIGQYVSAPCPVTGELTEADWLVSREILRKERLRFNKVAIGGYLLKAFRYGVPCPRCRDKLTQEPSDTDCPVCYGTGFEGGYHPALPLQCWDLSPQVIQEDIDSNLKGSARENAYATARVIGFPGLNYLDIWVNGTSDERWSVLDIQIAAAVRGVPLVYQVKLGLLPLSNTAYHLPLINEESTPTPTLPIAGTGCVIVNSTHNGGDYRYITADNAPVASANVYVFTKKLFDSAFPDNPARYNAVAGTTTTTTGAWATNVNLEPGEYVLLYEKADKYGPDIKPLTVVEAAGVPPASSSSSSASSVVHGPVRKVNNFWDI